MSGIPPIRARLGERLRAIRARRFRFGSTLAADLGWQQSKVSKLENARQLPTEDDIAAWLAACGGTADEAEELQALLVRARLEDRDLVRQWQAAQIADDQSRMAEQERRASVLAEYQPSMIPGLAQTQAYARAVLSIPGGPWLLRPLEMSTVEFDAEVDRTLAGRAERQQVLYMPGKRVRLLVGEAALYVRFGPPAEVASILAGQLDRLMTLVGLPSVEFGVLPFAAPSPVLPTSGIFLLDDVAAVSETLTREREVHEPAHVELYVRAFETGMSSAARGDDAVELIRRAARDL